MTKDVIGKASIGLDMRLKNRFFFLRKSSYRHQKALTAIFSLKCGSSRIRATKATLVKMYSLCPTKIDVLALQRCSSINVVLGAVQLAS